MSRRDLLVAMLQAFLLALFPWLRNERGALVVKEALEASLPKEATAIFRGGTFQISIGIKGYEISDNAWVKIMDKMGELPDGPKFIEVDDSSGQACVPAGEHDLSGVTLLGSTASKASL